MRTLGLIGGMSWESTIPYYRIINENVFVPAKSELRRSLFCPGSADFFVESCPMRLFRYRRFL